MSFGLNMILKSDDNFRIGLMRNAGFMNYDKRNLDRYRNIVKLAKSTPRKDPFLFV